MLKTIRLSKNIFSLTERLPKSKYQSPKVLTSGQNLIGAQSVKTKPLQGMSSASQAVKAKENVSNRNKSRLQEYLDSQNALGDDNDENNDTLENDNGQNA